MYLIDLLSKYKILLLVIAIPLIILFIFVREVSVLSGLILASLILSYLMGQWHMKAIGVELVFLITVLTGMTYGSTAGVIIGFFLITIHMITTEHLNVYLLWVIPGYSAVGFLAGITTMNITTFGIYATLGLNFINLIITAVVFRENVGKFLPFAITNVLFNAFLFLYVAPGIFSVMIM